MASTKYGKLQKGMIPTWSHLQFEKRCKICNETFFTNTPGSKMCSAECKDRRNKEWKRNHSLKQNYGIDQAEYDRLLLAQGGKCALCETNKPGAGKKNLFADHDHATGKVRGLLCNSCNTKLGDGNVEWLRKAIAFLQA